MKDGRTKIYLMKNLFSGKFSKENDRFTLYYIVKETKKPYSCFAYESKNIKSK